MIKKISNVSGWKKWLITLFAVLSFALLKSIETNAQNSVNGLFLSLLFVLAVGAFYWLIFEVVLWFFYGTLKNKIFPKISYNQFVNIFRFFIIFFNILLFFIFKLIILINFYANFLLLIVNLFFWTIFFYLMWRILAGHFFHNLANISGVSLCYFGFSFFYLFLQTILWGVL